MIDNPLSFFSIVVVALTTFFASSGFWLYMMKRIERKSDATQLLIGLAHEKIVSLGMTYIEQGSMTREQYESMHRYLYTPYIALGGNGMVHKIMTDLDKLPFTNTSRIESH